jgi:glucosamine kinase
MKNNFIIADSGATKCQWTIVQSNKKKTITTIGISPYFLSTEEIIQIIQKAFDKKVDCSTIKAVSYTHLRAHETN